MNVVYIIGGGLLLLWLISGIVRDFQGKNKIIQVVDNNCIGCQRCLKRCRHRVLDKVSDEKRTHVFVKNPDYCTACGDCMNACKFNALELIERK
ncbi:MAG: 4Fe-4S binding protein [Paludibacter sp.]|jgi:NAD-dependent dihydropyrimidine dehydrogenase PreA subunit|nr:4Fe-4S binding protein [Paludibacter sp.]